MATARQRLKALETRHEELRRKIKVLARPEWYTKPKLLESKVSLTVRTVLRDILYRDQHGSDRRSP